MTQGSSVQFKFIVTNTGNVTLTGITLTDSDFNLSCTITTTLAPGASFTCTISPPQRSLANTPTRRRRVAKSAPAAPDTDNANYFGLRSGQPSIQINSLSISINATRTTVTGQFNITDQSQGGNQPDGFLIALIDYGVRWEQKGSGKNAPFTAVVPSGGCTYTIISRDGVTSTSHLRRVRTSSLTSRSPSATHAPSDRRS